MSLFKGAGVALITPFNEDNSVNYEMLRTLVKRQIDGGTDAIIVCGTTGEPATMTEEEKLSVIKCVVDETAGRIPVIAGTGANCTQNVIDFSQKAEKLGVDVEFVEIDWDNKIMELDSKNIDVVWNGMTLTDEVTNSMECTNAYCNNAQVVVVPAE